MPYKSEAQRRYMYMAEQQGKVPKGTAERWERHTKDRTLPERVKKSSSDKRKIAVDLDGTLAKYDKWIASDVIGSPIDVMVQRVKSWLKKGHEVHIYTARAFPQKGSKDHLKAAAAIKAWCKKHIGQELPVTYKKDPEYTEFWDDKAVSVEMNTGKIVRRIKEAASKPYRNRVDVYAVNDKGELYAGKYPDGSVGLFGGGVDSGETVNNAAEREFKEEAGLRIKNPKRVSLSPYKESLIARKGWIDAGKTDRAKRYGGTRTYSVIADIVKGVKTKRTEPADHITGESYRSLKDVIRQQTKAVQKADYGKKGILKHRLRVLKIVDKIIQRTSKEDR